MAKRRKLINQVAGGPDVGKEVINTEFARAVNEEGGTSGAQPPVPGATEAGHMARRGSLQRYLLRVEYIGTSFSGWQKQDTCRTVQGVLEESFQKFIGQPVTVAGSSRTDTGVHALGNTCHVDVERVSKRRPEQQMPAHEPAVVKRALNHFLQAQGGDVALVAVRTVPSDFHARFQAQERTYHYRIVSGRDPPTIFESHRVWHVQQDLDLPAMQEACRILEGRHDFSSFRASGCQAGSPIKTLEELHVMEAPRWPAHFPDAAARREERERQLAATTAVGGRGREGVRGDDRAAGSGALEEAVGRDGGRGGGGRRGADFPSEGQGGRARPPQTVTGESGGGEGEGTDDPSGESLAEEISTSGAWSGREAGGRQGGGGGGGGVGGDGVAAGVEVKAGREGRAGAGCQPSPALRGYVVTARARSFLYHQVRLMVGLLKAVGCGTLKVNDVQRILEAKSVTAAPVMAPAHGLYLAHVKYNFETNGEMKPNGECSSDKE